ncbi:hypothetical protein L211DRAFT_869014 [Terfezia boudieri ATCC MYA-4762]|uniref:Uncharacterized protein n=1 Tax=Terfezia boudieri ATCC MYA-4762 TaxID=1051890 RepID=A0A3N4LMC9_9PEZI|nr:hypothetical protein L211DRAFT_869014 [Terfezia boudieri ATCC MYA-4762]
MSKERKSNPNSSGNNCAQWILSIKQTLSPYDQDDGTIWDIVSGTKTGPDPSMKGKSANATKNDQARAEFLLMTLPPYYNTLVKNILAPKGQIAVGLPECTESVDAGCGEEVTQIMASDVGGHRRYVKLDRLKEAAWRDDIGILQTLSKLRGNDNAFIYYVHNPKAVRSVTHEWKGTRGSQCSENEAASKAISNFERLLAEWIEKATYAKVLISDEVIKEQGRNLIVELDQRVNIADLQHLKNIIPVQISSGRTWTTKPSHCSCQSFSTRDICNVDETVFHTIGRKGKAPRGEKKIKTRMTVFFVTNADGSDKLKITIWWKGNPADPLTKLYNMATIEEWKSWDEFAWTRDWGLTYWNSWRGDQTR